MNKGQCVLTYLKKCDNVTKPKSSTLWECSVTFNDIPIIFCVLPPSLHPVQKTKSAGRLF